MCNCGKRRVAMAAAAGGGGGRGVGVGGRGVAAPAAPVFVPAAPAVVPETRAQRTYIPLHSPVTPARVVPAARQPLIRRAAVRGVRAKVGGAREGGIGGGAMEIVDPALWGPPLWRLLHTLAEIAGTDDSQADWAALFAALRTSLPCPECTHHYKAWFTAHPFTVNPATWVLDLHNDVNRRRGVEMEWSHRDVSVAYGVTMITDLQELLTRVRHLHVGEAACAVLGRMIAGLM